MQCMAENNCLYVSIALQYVKPGMLNRLEKAAVPSIVKLDDGSSSQTTVTRNCAAYHLFPFIASSNP